MIDEIQLAHGGGGILMQQLVRDEIIKTMGDIAASAASADSARIELPAGPVAFTTDSYVVQPIFFPGGDIGKLAIAGTVNDLATQGARPIAISLSLILEEGLKLATFRKILVSVAQVAKQASVKIVTGDTKVVERGAASEIFINTAGLGIMRKNIEFGAEKIEPGDTVIVSGTIGDHGIAVMSQRESLNFSTTIESDVAPLGEMVRQVLDLADSSVRCIKDPTRAGLAGCLNEMAINVGFALEQEQIPVHPTVRAACGMLGLDPMTVANEGKMVFIVASKAAQKVLNTLKEQKLGENAAIIGQANEKKGLVTMKTSIGGERIVDMPYGEQLPRIC